jgi:hypothetical protein
MKFVKYIHSTKILTTIYSKHNNITNVCAILLNLSIYAPVFIKFIHETYSEVGEQTSKNVCSSSSFVVSN